MAKQYKTAAIRFGGYTVLISVFLITICLKGVPALRHDWVWAVERSDFKSAFEFATSGWNPMGMGQPTLHINGYLLEFPIAALGLTLGPLGSLAAFLFAIAAYAFWSTRKLLCVLGVDSVVADLAFGSFFLFNPWTYTEIVAGHPFMILSLIAMMTLLSECLRPKPNTVTATIALVVSLCQLQFFVPALLFAVWLLWRHRVWVPISTGVVIALPTVVGFFGEPQSLRAIPFMLNWQYAQSIDLANVYLLLGYSAGYTTFLSGVLTTPLYGIVLCALGGVALSWRRPFALITTVLTILALVFATGSRGPIAALYDYLVQHMTIIALYRELYDVVGFAVIGYLVLSAFAWKTLPMLRWIFATSACLLLGIWVAHPPAAWWVGTSTIPTVTVKAPPYSRYALMPPFQPYVFGGHGSGPDPDARMLADGVVPLNEYIPSYPVDRALASYALTGSTSDLAALGVSAVYSRPWLHSDTFALRAQTAQRVAGASATLRNTSHVLRIANPMPLVSISEIPAVGSLDTTLDSGSVFYGDVAGLVGPFVPSTWRNFPTPRALAPSQTRTIDPHEDWVDARLSFAAKPRLAQQFGGVLTASKKPLSLNSSLPILAFVSGNLYDEHNRIVAKNTGGYQWVRLGKLSTTLWCNGLCLIALQGIVPDVPLNPPSHLARAIPFHVLTPWMIASRVTSRTPESLRLNYRYASGWQAMLDGKFLPHFRIDGVVNGWILPPLQNGDRVIIFDEVAAVQAFFECVALLWIAGLGLVVVRLRKPRERID